MGEPAISTDVNMAEFWANAEAEVAKSEGASDESDTEETDEASDDSDSDETEDEASDSGDDEDEDSADDESDDDDEDDKAKKKRGATGRVEPKERVQFRAEKRKWKAKQEAQRQELETHAQSLQKQYERYIEAEKLYESGDVEEAVEKLTGKSFADLAQDIIKKAQGVDLKAERRLKKLEEERAAERAEAEKLRIQQEQQRIAHQREVYAQEQIVKPLSKSGDMKPLLAIPGFVGMVLDIQLEAYQQDEEEIPVADAAKQAAKRYRKIYESLDAAFGSHPPAEDEGTDGTTSQSGAETVKRGRKRGRHIPKSRATSASSKSPPQFTDPDDPAWTTWFRRHMASATD